MDAGSEQQGKVEGVTVQPGWLDVVAQRWGSSGSGAKGRRWVIGIGVSLFVHLMLVLVAAFVYSEVRGDGEGDGPSYEMAIVTSAQLAEMEEASMGVDAVAVEVSLPEMEVAAELTAEIGDELPSVDVALSDAALGMGGAGGDLSSDQLETGGTGGGAASFFGVEAVGSRFVYVVDVSGSMDGAKVQRLKAELMESVSGLLEHASFYIVFYSSEAYPVGGRTKWIEASDSGKKWAGRFVQAVQAQGGTVPDPALRIAFSMQPGADAIYFMTDGEFDEGVKDLVARLNRTHSVRIPVHCITFGDRSSEPWMKEIAEKSGGTYTHIGVTQ